MSDEVDLSDLDLVDKVVIGKQITSGGFSDISLGTLVKDGIESKVAIKTLRFHGHAGPEATARLQKRFFREIHLWRTLQHENVVPLLGYTMPLDGPPTMVSPWYQGGNVINYIQSCQNPDRHALARDVIDGLIYLHSIPIAHGDLKAENVLVDADGHASLCDFGMSQFIDAAARIVGYTTTSAGLGGTDRFMCPELWYGDPKTTTTDMWAAGCLIVQILTDEMPYHHLLAKQAVYSAIMRGEPPSTSRKSAISVALWDCVTQCWSVTPAGRPKASDVGIHLAPRQDPPVEDFHPQALLPRTVFYNVRLRNGDYIMSAGAAHGIVKGTRLAVYQDKNPSPTTPPLGILIAHIVRAFSSALAIPVGLSLPDRTFALQTKVGPEQTFRLHVAMDEKQASAFQALATEEPDPGSLWRRVDLVEKEKAELEISLENDQVVFNILNSLITQFGLTRMPYSVSPNLDEVSPIIRAAAHFHWHLRRTSQDLTLGQGGVRMEIRTIEQLEDEDSHPVGEASSKNLNQGGVVDVVGGKQMYGVKIINESGLALYPALFYFDNSDFSITPYYQPLPRRNREEQPPLPSGDSLIIGYDASDSAPLSFVLPAGQNVDVGFLKLFLSTQYVDYSNMQQQLNRLPRSNIPQHWNISRHSLPKKGKRRRPQHPPRPYQVFDTVTVTVVIR